MPTFLLNPTVLVGLLLVLSVAGNGILYTLHTRALQQIGGLQQATRDARADAIACSEATKKLRREHEVRTLRVAEALHGAEARALEANQRADRTLQERPASLEACAAALDLNQRKMKERHP